MRPTPKRRPDPHLSNVVDSTGHWLWPFVVAPLLFGAAAYGLGWLVSFVWWP